MRPRWRGGAISWGSIIEVNFSGQITQSDFNSVKVGDSFSGTAFYSTTAPIQSSDPSPCGVPPIGCTAYYSLPLPVSVTVGASTVSSDPNTFEHGDDLQVSDTVSSLAAEAIWITGFYPLAITGPLQAEQLPAFDVLSISFFGVSSFDPIQLPVPFPELGGFGATPEQWKSAEVLFTTATGFSGPGTVQDNFTGNITSVSSQVLSDVPEPKTGAILGLAAAVVLRLKRRSSRLR